jgi:hypothetical protein
MVVSGQLQASATLHPGKGPMVATGGTRTGTVATRKIFFSFQESNPNHRAYNQSL